MLGRVGVCRSICDYIDTLVHPSVRGDALSTARHRLFIAPRLLGGLSALAAFPVYLALRGGHSGVEPLLFAWLVVPIAIACFLSRTGRYEAAHVMSALSFAALIMTISVMTGGVTSFTAAWLVVVPFEATLSASRRVVAVTSGVALATLTLLLFLGVSPAFSSGSALAMFGIGSAALYASGIALAQEQISRIGLGLLDAEAERYRLLARHMTDVIARHARDGTTSFVSPAAASLFGANPDELVGHGLFDRVHVADRPAYLTALSDAAMMGQERSVELRIRRETGNHAERGGIHFIWIEMRCHALNRDARPAIPPKPLEVVTIMRDISGRKLQDKVVEEARAESSRAKAAKRRFLATMSHELHTPLDLIVGYSDALRTEPQDAHDPDRWRECAAFINDSGIRLRAVVNDALDALRLDDGDFDLMPESFALGAVIGSCCDLLALGAKDAGLELSFSIAPERLEVVADKRAVRQIVMNLLSDALKSTGVAGRIKVGARAEGSAFLITVEGGGNGVGRGRSIVKRLVMLHGGEVGIHSDGQGTKVLVRMPRDCRRSQPTELRREHLPVPFRSEATSNYSDLMVKKRA